MCHYAGFSMYDIRLAAISGTVTILKILFDQRLLTKYLTKLPGLPSRLGSLRGSRVPAHLKKQTQSCTPDQNQASVLQSTILHINN